MGMENRAGALVWRGAGDVAYPVQPLRQVIAPLRAKLPPAGFNRPCGYRCPLPYLLGLLMVMGFGLGFRFTSQLLGWWR